MDPSMSEDYGVVPGQVVASRYRLLEPIGRGGMGSVWRAAELEAPHQEVALKLILPQRLETTADLRETAMGRFMREAEAMTKLKSPHVVHLLDHGREGAALVYIAMELLRGESLHARLRRRRQLDPETTLRVMTQIGRAVGLAHRHGIVHRDLKPANVFLCAVPGEQDFVAKVLDFGLAKGLVVPLLTLDVLTRGGALLGTPYYMSPEQARGSADADHRADLWSLGVMAFECLCGERPFRDRSLGKLLAHIAAGKPPVPSETAKVPGGFDEWFARAVQRDPAQRFPSADVMMDELREVLANAAIDTQARRRQLGASVSIDTMATGEDEQRTYRVERRLAGASFVDREPELAELVAIVTAGRRLVTITGPSGVGRTRLGRRLVEQLATARSCSFWTCWLEDTADEPWVWVEIARGLDILPLAGDPVAQIGRAIASLGSAIVLLDGLDQVRVPLRAALHGWIEDAPRILVVATATEPLGLVSERAYGLGPLGVPRRPVASLAALREHPAAELFVTRALGRDRTLLSADGIANEIGLLVARTGGVPLGIELAASFAGSMRYAAISRGRCDALAPPCDGAGTGPEGCLDSVVAWTFATLAPHERSALAQCSVFRGGFTLEAAEAVVDTSSWQLRANPFEVILALANRGLLRCDEPLIGDVRLDMPPVLRAHAGAELDRDGSLTMPPPMCTEVPARIGAEAAERRHGWYYARLGDDEALTGARRRGGVHRRTRLELEAHNLIAARDRAITRGDGGLVAATGRAVVALLGLHGLHREAAQSLLPLVARTDLDPRERLTTQLLLGECSLACGRTSHAADAFERARRLAAETGDRWRETEALGGLGRTALQRRDLAQAASRFAAALALAQDSRHLAGQAQTQAGQAQVALGRGDERTALSLLTEAATNHRRLGNRQLEAEALSHLGAACTEHELTDQARGWLTDALALHGELGNHHEHARLLGLLGELELRCHQPVAARAVLERATARAKQLGLLDLAQHVQHLLALAVCRCGDPPHALRLIAGAERLGPPGPAAERALGSSCQGLVAVAAGEHACAAAALAEADRCLTDAKATRTMLAVRLVAELRREIDGAVTRRPGH